MTRAARRPPPSAMIPRGSRVLDGVDRLDRPGAGPGAGARRGQRARRARDDPGVVPRLRGRHDALTFDDHLTDYHEAIERLLGHVAGRNEIRLTAKDYADAEEDLHAAQAAWQLVQPRPAPPSGQPGWTAAARAATAALAEAARALASQNATASGQAAEQVQTTYYDLLMAVARARD